MSSLGRRGGWLSSFVVLSPSEKRCPPAWQTPKHRQECLCHKNHPMWHRHSCLCPTALYALTQRDLQGLLLLYAPACGENSDAPSPLPHPNRLRDVVAVGLSLIHISEP